MELYDSEINESSNDNMDDERLEDEEENSLQENDDENEENSSSPSSSTSSTGDDGKKKSGAAPSSNGDRKKGGTSVKDKEPHMVQRRNARERRRVQLVNDGFTRLRRKIPTEPRNKKLSKVKTLQCAINYILHLQETLDEADKLQRAAGMMDFSPAGLGGSMTTMNPSPYNNAHHMGSQPGHHEGLTSVPMQAGSCYNDSWGYFENPPMVS